MKKLKIFIFLFILVQGIFYLFFIPPWQSPDEIHHFGYGSVLTEEKEDRNEYRKEVEKDIVESMATFHAWQYLFLERPQTLPNRLRLPYFHGIGGLIKRGPLYYFLSSRIIKGFQIDGLINQFYSIRIFSFLLFGLTVYFTYLSSRIVFKKNPLYSLAVVSFVGFLPQFLVIQTSVNPVTLLVFLYSLFIYLLIYSYHKGKKWVFVLLGPLIIGAGFFTHRAALFMIPPFLVLLLIFFIQSIGNKREFLKITALLLILILIFVGVYFGAKHFFPEAFKKVINMGGTRTIGAFNSFINYFSRTTSKSLGNFLEGFFKSFWFLAGWLSVSYVLDIYSVFKFISILAAVGLCVYMYRAIFKSINSKPSVELNYFWIIAAAGLPIILGAIVHCLPRYPVAQGRYVFPAIMALGVLFVLGIKEITPPRMEKWPPIFIICGFVVLNIYTLFSVLVRVFYFFTKR